MDTLRLTLLRHGQAQPVDSCPDDFERALTHRGTIDAREMATRIVRRDLVPDLILTSPAERTWATASILAAVFELDAKQLRAARELYLATPETLWRVLTRHDPAARHLMICGHNPSLSRIASRFGPKPEPRDLRTAGLATAVWTPGEWNTLEPETAGSCDLDDPENMADLWP
jgi:phosphohistidine phosphatase